jgi:RNA polymerase sigma-70 factor (ECF subfamily)
VTASSDSLHADAQLAASGDAEAFERLYRATVDRIYALVRRMAGAPAADDLTQEVYLRAWSKLHTFRGDAAFPTWLHRLAVNLVLGRRETLRRRESRFLDGEGLIEGMAARLARPGLRMDFERAIEHLPPRAREVFVLYDVEGYPHDEIAQRLDITVGTSKSQLHRARMILRNHLD